MSETVPSRRPQQRAIETRGALLDTAIATFSTRGFDGISIRQLEELAGVKRGLVAYHFGDKDALWREAADRLFGELAEDFLSRLDTLSEVAPAEAARGIIRAFVRFSAARPELNRMMMQESVAESWRVAYIVNDKIKPLLDAVYDMMPEDSNLLWGDRDPHRDDFVERHVDMVVNLLMSPKGSEAF